MKKQAMYLLLGVLIVLQVFSLMKISLLQNQIDAVAITVQSAENSLSSQINYIDENIDQQLEEQGSLIYSSSLSVGKLDVDTLTVPVTFTVKPKTLTENTTISLDFNGDIMELEQSGLQFSGTKNFNISDEISPEIIIDNNGVKNIEASDGLRLINIKDQVFPYFFAFFEGNLSFRSTNSYSAKGDLVIDYNPVTEDIEFVEMKYVVKIGEEIVSETPIEVEDYGIYGARYEIGIEQEYSVDDGQTLTSSVVALDNYGFTHECLVTRYLGGSQEQDEHFYGVTKIFAPNGELVYILDEEKLK